MDVPPLPSAQPPTGLASSLSRDTLIEILGYFGAAVALAAATVALDPSSKTVQTLFNAVVALALLASGWAVGEDSDVLRRMRSVFWFLSVGSFAGFLTGVLGDMMDVTGRTLTVAVAGVTTIFSAILWMMSKRSLQVIALFFAGLVTAVAIIFPDMSAISFIVPPDFTGVALVVTAWGLMSFGLGWKGLIQPRRTAMVLGSIAAIYGPSVKLQFQGQGELIWEVGSLAIAVLALAVGALIGERAPAGIGIAGLLVVTSVIVADQTKEQAPAVVLVVVGVALLAVAIAAARGAFGGARPAAAADPPPPVPPSEV